MTNLMGFVRVLLLAAALAATIRPTAAQQCHLLQKIEITPGAGIFDYAATDRVNRRVYLSHGEELGRLLPPNQAATFHRHEAA